MNKKSVFAEPETDSAGKQIPYDIFANRHFPHETRFIAPHTHTYFETILVLEGMGTDTCSGELVYAEAGDIVFVPPNLIHNFSFAPKRGVFQSIVVKFSLLFLYPLEATPSDVNSLFVAPSFDLPIQIFRKGTPETDALRTIICDIFQEYEEKKFGYELALRGKMTGLYLFLVRLLATAPKQSDPIDYQISLDSTANLRKALSYIENNFVYNISMQEVAEHIEMDYYQFSRFFQHMTGKHFTQYLSDIRLSYANKLLLKKDKSISQVAIESGFDYLSYFIRKFKKQYGLTPRDFQKKYCNQQENIPKELPEEP